VEFQVAKAAMKKTAIDDTWTWMASMNDKYRWSTIRIPDGELHAPYIKQMSKNDDGTYSFYIYRNGKAIGSVRDKDTKRGLALAQKHCQAGKVPGMDEAAKAMKVMNEYVANTPKDADAFKKLTELAQKVVANEFPWAMPGRRAQEEKGIKHIATKRTDLQTNREKAASRSTKWSMEATICRVNKAPNPKKAGSVQWQRWEVLLAMDGKTVAEFFAKGGDKYGLEGGLEHGWVELR
jgi:hypothetical protein